MYADDIQFYINYLFTPALTLIHLFQSALVINFWLLTNG